MCRWGGLLLVITGPTPPPLPTPHNVQPVRVEALCHTPPPYPPHPTPSLLGWRPFVVPPPTPHLPHMTPRGSQNQRSRSGGRRRSS